MKANLKELREEFLSEVTRINNDKYGNPRYYISWFMFADFVEGNKMDFDTKIRNINNAVKLFSKYRGKKYGAGFVFQSYNLDDTFDKICKYLGLED